MGEVPLCVSVYCVAYRGCVALQCGTLPKDVPNITDIARGIASKKTDAQE